MLVQLPASACQGCGHLHCLSARLRVNSWARHLGSIRACVHALAGMEGRQRETTAPEAARILARRRDPS